MALQSIVDFLCSGTSSAIVVGGFPITSVDTDAAFNGDITAPVKGLAGIEKGPIPTGLAGIEKGPIPTGLAGKDTVTQISPSNQVAILRDRREIS
jgi:hypothetical protein